MATAYAAGTTSMIAAPGLRPRLSTMTSFSRRCSSRPYLPPCLASSIKLPSESKRFSLLKIRASSSEDTSGSLEVGEIVSDLKEKWDALEDKSTVLLYGGGAIVAVWLSSIVVGAINSVPLVPKFLELVGLGYTGWFVYRYLLFKNWKAEVVRLQSSLEERISIEKKMLRSNSCSHRS